jgi:hypothetical protein
MVSKTKAGELNHPTRFSVVKQMFVAGRIAFEKTSVLLTGTKEEAR